MEKLYLSSLFSIICPKIYLGRIDAGDFWFFQTLWWVGVSWLRYSAVVTPQNTPIPLVASNSVYDKERVWKSRRGSN